jgi:hypothetical protein
MGDGAMSTLKVNTLQDTSGNQLSSARLWGVVSGRGTFQLNDDVNISSATDSGTGRYTFNFGITLSSNSYCPATCDGLSSVSWDASTGLSRVPFRTTTTAGINTSTHISGVSAGNEEDMYNVAMAIFAN